MPSPPADFELEEPLFPTNTARLRRWIPWIRLLDGFRLAIDPRCLFAALCAVIFWSAGDLFLAQFHSGPPEGPLETETPRWPWDRDFLPAASVSRGRVDFVRGLESPGKFLVDMVSNGHVSVWPLRRLVEDAIGISRPDNAWRATFLRIGALLWGLSICAFFGTAICRMASLEFSGNGSFRFRDIVRFAAAKCPSVLGAPLIALVWLILLLPLIWFVGLLSLLPWVGGELAGACWGLVYLAGMGMALLAVGVAAGFPLMVAAVSAESSDAFDGFSRSFSYIFNRPWYTAFLIGSGMLLGSVLLCFVVGVLTLTADLGTGVLLAQFGNLDAAGLYDTVADREPFAAWQFANSGTGDTMSEAGRQAIGVWCRLLLSIPAAFVFSYFWTMSTIVYYLLRLREDATPLDEVVIQGTSSRKPPLIGIPAAAAREREAREDNGQSSGPPDAEAP